IRISHSGPTGGYLADVGKQGGTKTTSASPLYISSGGRAHMGAEIVLHSAWDAYCERLALPKERGRVDPMTKVDPMHLGRGVWHRASGGDRTPFFSLPLRPM